MKFVTQGLQELRAISADGISRSFFFFSQGKQIYIVHIFQKKTQKTPKKEIEMALKIKEEYENEK